MKLYQRNGIWWVTYGTAPRIRLSTGCRDKKSAEEHAVRIIAPAAIENEADVMERVLKLRRKAEGKRAAATGLAELFEPAKYQQRHGCKYVSAAAAGRYWRRFVVFCTTHGICTVEDLTPDVCAAFLCEVPVKTRHMAVIYCRQILRDVGCQKTLWKNARQQGQVTHREPLTHEQIAALLAAADRRGEEFRMYIRALIYTGLRMGDCATLTAGMYDQSSRSITRRMAKTGRKVQFPLHPALHGYFDRPRGEEFIFPAVAALYRKNQCALSLRIRKVFAEARITGAPGQYCAHCLRTTFASLCAEHGVPLAVIQSWLGHTSPMVTRVYARIEDMQRKREALERFPDIG